MTRSGRFVATGWLLVGGLVVLSACGSEDAKSDESSASAAGAAELATTTTSRAAAPASSPTTTPSTEQAALVLVALGDSDTTGSGDPTGQGWVGRYADLVRRDSGRDVTIVQRAHEGLTSDRLLADLHTDEDLRSAVADADIIVIGEGGADLNSGDDAFAAGTCSGKACYENDLASFARNIEAQVNVIAQLRDGKPTVLRAITLPNGLTGAEDVIPPFLGPVATEVGVYQATALRQGICDAMENHGGKCIDVLAAFNGPDGTNDAYALGLMNHDDCCYPSGDGQQRIAQLLIDTGLDAMALTSGP